MRVRRSGRRSEQERENEVAVGGRRHGTKKMDNEKERETGNENERETQRDN